MLYSLLTAVIVLSFLMPFVGVMCFIKGYNLNAKKQGETTLKEPHLSRRKPVQSKEERDLSNLLENIEAFDGSGVSQKEFK